MCVVSYFLFYSFFAGWMTDAVAAAAGQTAALTTWWLLDCLFGSINRVINIRFFMYVGTKRDYYWGWGTTGERERERGLFECALIWFDMFDRAKVVFCVLEFFFILFVWWRRRENVRFSFEVIFFCLLHECMIWQPRCVQNYIHFSGEIIVIIIWEVIVVILRWYFLNVFD